jgi:hypothetical protein
MTMVMKMKLAVTPGGRIVLHVLCVLHGGNVRWHWAGIKREFAAARLKR